MLRILHGVLPVLAAVLAIGPAVSACSSLGQVTEAEQQQILATAQAPRLQSGEKIRITVCNEPSLSGDFQIDPSGFVSLPLADTVKVAGLVQAELAGIGEEIRQPIQSHAEAVHEDRHSCRPAVATLTGIGAGGGADARA